MTPPAPSLDANNICEQIDRALHGIELEPEETAEILGFANQELPYLLTPQTSYFVLGSYREPYLRRLRRVENLLNRRLQAYAFLMGDLADIEIDRLPTFRIRFHLLATYADYVVGVYEQGGGGEITELGKVSETPYFEKCYVLPRDYAWMTAANFESQTDVLAAAVAIHFSDDIPAESRDDEFSKLIGRAADAGLDVSRAELEATVKERAIDDSDVPSYSWVHLNEFRLFELHNRCVPWSREEGLEVAVESVPSPVSNS